MPRPEPGQRSAGALPSTLRTRHLLLRPFSADDGAAVFAYWQSDPAWARFNESVPDDFDAQDAAAFVARMCARDRNDAPHWALVCDARVVGVVSLSFGDGHRNAVLGFGIHADLRGRGYCGEAATAVLDAAFDGHETLGVVLAHTDVANEASMRVLAKLGFEEGRDDRGAVFRLTRAAWRARGAG